ncbi:cytochrome c [Sphingomonas quercus]|uniref:Cytochrome c n=1 Tax=Sphingomonas quercus TaxID=2842451 RepID=A0ABS6BGS0_9SPHN|nr:cytochrome c [Sphingomonas quercus]MBU3077489.1 cytochrome c [Sphingomonas quercus]
MRSNAMRAALALTALAALAGCQGKAKQDNFVHADEDYFHDMDNAVALTREEVQGRNMWLVWSGGNDRFWDFMNKPTLGGFDLLKIVAPDPNGPNRRDNRWRQLGIVNEPCFAAPARPDQFGLWRDQRQTSCPPDPFANAQKYPGVKSGALGRVLPAGSFYGEPTGIVGLRLFPNPDFDEKARAAWDGKRYYSDPNYYNRKDLIRPYRVGMSCGFCHVGPSPIHPPKDPEHPTFAELNSTVGAQYMWVDRIFFWSPNPANFMYQLVKTYRPGSMDTSLVSTDNINNPRTMNAVYSLGPRLEIARRLAHEQLGKGSDNNRQFNEFVKDGPLTRYFNAPRDVWTPHVLKDGSDSVGALGALNRVYINIGLDSEEWLKHFNPVVGGKPISPITIESARKNAYWRATEMGTPATALFFLKAARPDRLSAAPGGAAYLAQDAALVAQGRDVFATTCARCHSSKQPDAPPAASLGDPIGADYVKRFHAWWRWTQTDDFKSRMRAIAARPDFLDNNFLSSDIRVPQTLLRTNMCSPLATNALRGNIWDNFSSETYKDLPSIGQSSYQDPFTGRMLVYTMPAGGRGFTRPPSLISLWSTAPYLLNNSVGDFNGDPSVAGRMKMFDVAIQQMLWPERRPRDGETPNATGVIDRTTARSFFFVPQSWIPRLPGTSPEDNALLKSLVNANGDISIGPIPKGMPVNLLASFQPLAESANPVAIARHYHEVLVALVELKRLLLTLPRGADDAALRAHFAPMRAKLMALSKCPDFVVNRGHYFGTAQFNQQHGLTPEERSFGQEAPLSDDRKRALIAFLKTL